jgi:methionyl-tRNA formyltransferase
MKIVFFGTPAFSVPFLEALINEPSFEIVSVITQPDKPSGRGGKIVSPEVKLHAQKNNIPVLQLTNFKTQSVVDALKAFQADFFVVVAFGKIIPSSILQIPPKGVVNVHPSLLPKYRGPSPIQSAILNGDKETGISIMLLDSGMDTGPIIAQKKIELNNNETTLTLEKKIHGIGSDFLVSTLKEFIDDKLIPKQQVESGSSFTKLFEKEDGRINWNKSAIEIERMVRAFLPWPTAWTVMETKNELVRVKIIEAKTKQIVLKKPAGTIIENDGSLLVSAGSNTL